MTRFILALLPIMGISNNVAAQSTAFVFNAGPSFGFQKWENGGDKQVLFAYHASFGIESVNNEDDNISFVGQLGYHVKGSANRLNFLSPGGGIAFYSEQFRYNNLSLLTAIKLKFPLGNTGRQRYFYLGGIRGDYTVSTNIDELNQDPLYYYYPQVEAMNRWMFGLTIGGGWQFEFSELVGGQITISLNPDVTPQITQPQITVYDPYNPGQLVTIPAQRVRNTTIEISFGIRLLRKVVYVED